MRYESGGGSDRALVDFFHTDYPSLDKLLALCPFVQIVIPHENHADCFS